jgi:hypothetical protein
MWRELTEADLQGVLSAPELDAYELAAVAGGQSPMADAISTVVNQCRGYIADHPSNTLAAGLTLPERAILPALHIIRVEILTRLDMEVSKDRADSKRDAIRFFERVSEGKVAVESATTDLDTEESSVPVLKTSNSRERIATREKLSGL